MNLAVEADALCVTYVTRPHSLLPWARQRRIDALVDVSLRIEFGEVFGLVGRNGYGKTTLIKCICSLVEPRQGTLRVFGRDCRAAPTENRRTIGYVSAEDRSFYFRLTGRQNLLFFARLHGIDGQDARRLIDTLAERLDIAQLLDRRFHEYSTGNRQRLSLARALLHDPTLLVLDEPTRSLDPFAAEHLRRTLSAWVREGERRTVLVTSHNLAEVEGLSHRVGIMSRGRLRETGSLAALRRRFGDHERVRLWVAEPSSLTGHLTRLNDSVPTSLGCDRERGPYLEFRRAKDDAQLDFVLRTLLEANQRLVSFDRIELSLQDIIDRVDEEGSGA